MLFGKCPFYLKLLVSYMKHEAVYFPRLEVFVLVLQEFELTYFNVFRLTTIFTKYFTTSELASCEL